MERDRQKQQQEEKLQATLDDYLKQMNTLLLDKELSTKPHEHPTAQVARVLTITAIKALDSERNHQLTNFLFNENLIQEAGEENNLPWLLLNANLNGANLEHTNLFCANLKGAILFSATVEKARFGNNEGIDEEMKADLIKRGAIFLEESTETDKT